MHALLFTAGIYWHCAGVCYDYDAHYKVMFFQNCVGYERHQDHFNARLVTGNTGEVYARTGYLGFLRRTEAIGSDGGEFH